MTYLITYDLKKPGQNYDELHKAIRQIDSNCWHGLESTWLVNSRLSAQQISDVLKSKIDPNDSLLVIGVTTERQGWLSKKDWEWINQYLD